jgi:hypothetical protein
VSPSPTPTPPATVIVTDKKLDKKKVTITFKNNSTVAQVLTGLSITWPQATNGNLTSIKFNGTTIYNTPTGGGSLTIPPPPLSGTTAQRTMAVGASEPLEFNFLSNVNTNAANYTGSATFNPFGPVTTLP